MRGRGGIPQPVLAVLMILLAAPVSAGYSGLTLIPTADMVPRGEYTLELQIDGTIPATGVDIWLVNTQFGLSDRMEAGLDLDLSEEAETRALLNAKYLLHDGRGRGPSLAVGTANVGTSLRASPYLVMTQHFGPARCHVGGIRTESSNHWFVGVDRALTDRLTVLAEHISGEENFSSGAVSYQFSDRFGVHAAVQVPNSSDADVLYTVHFVLSGPLKGE